MHAFMLGILDILFPPREEELVVRALTEADIEHLMIPTRYTDIVSLMPYRNPKVRALIWQLKYKGDTKAASLLAHAVRCYIADTVTDPVVLLPVPLATPRMRERGYNQITLVGRMLTDSVTNLYLDTDVLIRTKHRDRQTDLSRLERLRNMRGAFSLKNAGRIAGTHVIILDDVTTTGATLRETEKAVLQAKPASVRKIALAH